MRRVNVVRIESKEFEKKNPLTVALNIRNSLASLQSSKVTKLNAIVMMDEEDLQKIFNDSQAQTEFYVNITDKIKELATVLVSDDDAETLSIKLSEAINNIFDFIQTDASKRAVTSDSPKNNPNHAEGSPSVKRSGGNGGSLDTQLPSIIQLRPSGDGTGHEEN